MSAGPTMGVCEMYSFRPKNDTKIGDFNPHVATIIYFLGKPPSVCIHIMLFIKTIDWNNILIICRAMLDDDLSSHKETCGAVSYK